MPGTDKNIYYVNLSTLPREIEDKPEIIDNLHAIEEGRCQEEEYGLSERGGERTLLNKYHLAASDSDEKIFFGNSESDVYGIQTNEASVKSLLKQGVVLDEVILVASEAVYQGSGLKYCDSSDNLFLENKPNLKKKEDSHFEITADKLDLMLQELQAYSISECSHFENVADKPDQEAQPVDPQIKQKICTLDYFLMEICYFCENVVAKNMSDCIKKVLIYPMDNDPDRSMMTNCAMDVASEILQAKRDSEVHLYIDSNGGKRDQIIIQIAVLRVLRVQGIEPEMVMYSNYMPSADHQDMDENSKKEPRNNSASGSDDENKDRNNKWGNNPVQIINKKHEYKIFDLVSGIDEFISYGRVEKLQHYFEVPSLGIEPVLNSIDNMCKTFQTCFANEMVDSVVNVRRAINEFKSENSTSEHGSDPRQSAGDFENQSKQHKLTKYIVDQIEKDLQDVLTAAGGESSDEAAKADAVLPLIEWCRNKKYYQQAITLYVDRIDTWYYEKGILIRPANEKDLYTYLYDDCLEKEYYQKLNEIHEQFTYDKSDVVKHLRDFKNENIDSLNTCKIDQKIREIENFYENDGCKKSELSGDQNNLPDQLREYVKQLQEDINNNITTYVSRRYNNEHSPSDIENMKSQLLQIFSPHLPKAFVVNEMNGISCADLDIDSNLFMDIVNDIRNGFEDNGDNKKDRQLLTSVVRDELAKISNLYEVNKALSESYRKVCNKYRDCNNLRTQLNSDSRNETYVKKKICVQHYSSDYADNIVLLNNAAYNGQNMGKFEILKQISEFYLAFKVVRNNTNHSNGQGDIYTKKACEWLGSADGGNIIDLSTCEIYDDKITLKYDTIENLLDKAIRFNKALVS